MRKAALVGSPIVLFLVNTTLVLTWVWERYFVSVTLLHFATLVWGVAAGVFAIAVALRPAIAAAKAIITGRQEAYKKISADQLLMTSAETVGRQLRRPAVSVVSTAVLALVLVGFLIAPKPTDSPRIASGVLAVTVGHDKFIYVTDPDSGNVRVFRSSKLDEEFTRIPLGSPPAVRPESMLEFRRASMHLIFVTDSKAEKVHVIDVASNTIFGPALSVGKTPRSMAITPDNRRLFVSNEQPIPSGTITVIDLSGDSPIDFHVATTINGVLCPEGMSISPRGDRLYVATQCGGDKDPVLIFDTATAAAAGAFPGLPVGTSVAVNPSGDRAYVTRGNYPCYSAQGEAGSPFSVLNLDTGEVKSVCLRTSVGSLAVSRGGLARYVYVANGNYLTVFDREKLDGMNDGDASALVLNDIPLEGPVAGIAVADDDSVYAYVPRARRLFLYSPVGLLP